MNPATPIAKQLLGYADEVSVISGQTIAFYVSGQLDDDYTLTVHRLLGGGSDPAAPALRSEPVATLGHFPVLDQPVTPGSYAVATLTSDESAAFATPITLVVTLQPSPSAAQQTVLQLSGLNGTVELGLTETGHTLLRVGADQLIGPPVSGGRRWSTVVATWSKTSLSLSVGDGQKKWDTEEGPTSVAPPTRFDQVLIGAARDRDGRRHRHYGGRVERPTVLAGAFRADEAAALAGGPGDAVPEEALLLWELNAAMNSWTVPGHGQYAAPLTFHNAPKRAACGSRWKGASNWQDSPREYGAALFYPDSLEDCEWTAQVAWTVPSDARSGFYAARVLSGEHEDWIPFFVRPPAGKRTADLVVLASTATYFAYANSRFWWEDPIQEIAQDRLVELGPDEQYLVHHPELGLSNYDLHDDGSPVVFSSRRRPNLFMRPGHSRGESYASDLYLVAWLEHLGVDYDVVADEDLHFGGAALLSGYRVAVSGSHPEYLSIPMYDATQDWVRAGGRYLYLGGNGFTSCVTWGAERPWLMENRATGRMRIDDERARAEAVNQLDGQLGAQLADSGRSPGSLWGVDSVTMGFDRSYPVLRTPQSYLAEFAFAFVGLPRRLFGGRSLSGGGVIGQEWDNARLVAGAPGHHVLAASIDHSLIPDVLGADPEHHGDVVLFFHRQGVVFSASSMAWAGALHVDGYDNDAETFLRNVLNRFLDPAPMAQPATQEAKQR